MYKMTIFAPKNDYEKLEYFYKMDLSCTTGDLHCVPFFVLQ